MLCYLFGGPGAFLYEQRLHHHAAGGHQYVAGRQLPIDGAMQRRHFPDAYRLFTRAKDGLAGLLPWTALGADELPDCISDLHSHSALCFWRYPVLDHLGSAFLRLWRCVLRLVCGNLCGSDPADSLPECGSEAFERQAAARFFCGAFVPVSAARSDSLDGSPALLCQSLPHFLLCSGCDRSPHPA